MTTERNDGSNGLTWFLRENVRTRDLRFAALLTVFGGYFSYRYYGIVLAIVPVVLFTVITTEVGLWYVRNFDIVPWIHSTELNSLEEEERTALSEQVKGSWKVIGGLVGSASSWLVLLGIVSATPGGPPSNVPPRDQLLLEVFFAGRAIVVLLVFLVSVHLLLSGTTVGTESNSFEG